MSETHNFLIPIISLISFFLIFKFLIRRKVGNLPPSPPSLPIIGHLHLIRAPVHRTLQQLSSKYGPIMRLRFGSRPVLILTSPSLVEECYTKNDVVLANIPQLHSRSYFDYDGKALVSAPYGNLWRDLRRITTLELVSTSRLKYYMGVRQEEVTSFLKGLFPSSSSSDQDQDSWRRVEMKSRLQDLTFRTILRMVTGVKDLEETSKFRELVKNVFGVIGSSNPQDFIPFLQWIDFQGFEKRLLKLRKETDNFTQSLIQERRSKLNFDASSGEVEAANTFMDALLYLQKSDPEYYNDDVIKANVLTSLMAGTDASAVTTEWAMAQLLNNPDVLKKAIAEVDEQIGHERLVQETDLPSLPYIQCIVNETLRLNTSGPLLVPHEPSEDLTIGGFHVPRGTMVMVNAWAIHRDPNVWEDPLSFKPERFEKGTNEGQGYRFLPFGKGRRQCPGIGLANRVVGLALASLLQCFEWERVGEELIDMTEGTGLSMPKKEPLEVMCKVRKGMNLIV